MSKQVQRNWSIYDMAVLNTPLAQDDESSIEALYQHYLCIEADEQLQLANLVRRSAEELRHICIKIGERQNQFYRSRRGKKLAHVALVERLGSMNVNEHIPKELIVATATDLLKTKGEVVKIVDDPTPPPLVFGDETWQLHNQENFMQVTKSVDQSSASVFVVPYLKNRIDSSSDITDTRGNVIFDDKELYFILGLILESQRELLKVDKESFPYR